MKANHVLLGLLVAAGLGLLFLGRSRQDILYRLADAESEIRRLRHQLASSGLPSTKNREALIAHGVVSFPPERSADPPIPPELQKGLVPFGPDNSAKLQRLQTLREKAALDRNYASLFRRLKLEPGQLERFKVLLVERKLVAGDVIAAAVDRGIDLQAEPLFAEQIIARGQSDVDSAIQSLLGRDSYGVYEAYRHSLAQRAVVEQLALRLSYTSEPLADNQSEQLVEVLTSTASSEPSVPPGPVFTVSAVGTAVSGVTISDEAVARAAIVLTPGQQGALLELREFQLAQREVTRSMPLSRTQGVGLGRSFPPGR